MSSASRPADSRSAAARLSTAATWKTDWAGDATAMVDFVSRFVRPIVVPSGDDGVAVELAGKVSEKRPDGTVRVTVVAKASGAAACKATAVVRLPAVAAEGRPDRR